MRKQYKCIYCGAPIRFERTAAGKVIAVDMSSTYYIPCKTGGVLLLDSKGRYVKGEPGKAADEAVHVADVPHFVTCRRREIEKADRFKRRAQKKEQKEEEQKRAEEEKRLEAEKKLIEKQRQLRFM